MQAIRLPSKYITTKNSANTFCIIVCPEFSADYWVYLSTVGRSWWRRPSGASNEHEWWVMMVYSHSPHKIFCLWFSHVDKIQIQIQSIMHKEIQISRATDSGSHHIETAKNLPTWSPSAIGCVISYHIMCLWIKPNGQTSSPVKDIENYIYRKVPKCCKPGWFQNLLGNKCASEGESSAKKILRTQTERNWICIHKLQVIFISNHDSWLPLENLPFTHRKSVKGKGWCQKLHLLQTGCLFMPSKMLKFQAETSKMLKSKSETSKLK